MKWRLSVKEVLAILGTELTKGEHDGDLTGMADLRTAVAGDLSFLRGHKYAKYLSETQAGVIIVPEDQKGEPHPGQLWIYSKDPSLDLARICRHVEALVLSRPKAGIHPSAIVDPGASVDPSAHVGPFCIVEADVSIGKHVVLESNVRVEKGARIGEGTFLYHNAVIGWGCEVGQRCRIFQGAVIGADGFGYHSDKNGHHALPQIGIVVLEDDVDMGSNSCIDRARFAATRVGKGTKIDNQVQIGHNVIIGQHCILCAHVGISGSVEIGNFVILAGQVGVSGHLKIGDGVTATGQTGITKDVPPGTVLSGTPGRPHREEMKRQVLLKQLPEMNRRLRALEKTKD